MYAILFNCVLLSLTRASNFGIINVFLYDLNNFKLNLLLIIIWSFIIFNVYTKWYLLVWILILFYYYTNNFSVILNNFFTGFYKIHPPLLYYALTIFYFYISIKKKINKYSILFLTKTIIITFCLGSLWALTQFIWGRYWSNDSIEIILVLFIGLSLCYIHKFYKNKIVFSNFFFFNFILLLFSLRLNLIFTKHNFFQKLINLQLYFSLIYFFYVSYIVGSYGGDNKKFILIFKNSYFLLYIFLIEIFSNYLNTFVPKKINTFLWKLFINFSIFYLFSLSSVYFIHWILIMLIIVFNLFSILYLKYFISLKTTYITRYISHFLIKQNHNFWIFKKLRIYKHFYFMDLSYIKNKNFSNFQSFKNINVTIINFF